ncbi:MAG: glutamine synthetase [Marinilabiliales bacterium]|nr:MAG: glutamine synthetase [Marinilabiliales bacterium]
MSTDFSMCPNLLVQYLQKSPENFTKKDIIDFVENNGIEMLNFHYIGGDGRIKTLNFVILGREHLEQVLQAGERVDGSSLFNHMEAGSSDLYVVPKYKSAFVNPFSEIPTLGLFCRYFDKDGKPLASSPGNILLRAHEQLVKETGYELQAMGELEYYLISEREDLFEAKDQRAYHESFPFTKWEDLRKEAMYYIAQMGGKIKYGHSEVGNFHDELFNYEQNEIEYLPTRIDEAAEQLILGKWVLRSLAYKYDVNLSFAPKITVGKAGSGLHIHMKLMKDGVSAMEQDGRMSDAARKAIAGILKLSPSLTAFGNTVPTSYLRLVPHQEAPTNICWGDRNRSTLVRVPLGWSGEADKMIQIANATATNDKIDASEKQTFEFRCPDGSADIYLLLAGLTVAVRHGLKDPDALKKAEELYVGVNIFEDKHKDVLSRLKQLPVNCFQSAQEMKKQMAAYLEGGVFPENILNSLVEMLEAYDDNQLSEKLFELPDEERFKRIYDIVMKYMHC